MTSRKSLPAPNVKSGPKNFAMQGDDGRLTVTVEEAGELLGLSRGSAYAYAKDGTIPTIRVGNRLLVPRVSFMKMLGITP